MVKVAPWDHQEGSPIGASETFSKNIGGALTVGIGFESFTKMISAGEEIICILNKHQKE